MPDCQPSRWCRPTQAGRHRTLLSLCVGHRCRHRDTFGRDDQEENADAVSCASVSIAAVTETARSPQRCMDPLVKLYKHQRSSTWLQTSIRAVHAGQAGGWCKRSAAATCLSHREAVHEPRSVARFSCAPSCQVISELRVYKDLRAARPMPSMSSSAA